ncbi:hypothetical protein DRO26_02660 [Candidatus Bathyarchaeota archaeon]|nr:MAG: hypothetical protein DRO26_02660 [Candidatus Bathyarchaeota archaeon]
MIMVKFVIPSIRVVVAKKLVEEYGLSQAETARRLQVTRAAITQYLKGLRGEEEFKFLEKSSKVKKAMEKLTKELAKENPEVPMILKSLCEVCKTIRREHLICSYCGEELPELKKTECNICF